MKALLLLALVLVLINVPSASAEEPTGFAEFPWGTSKATLQPICDAYRTWYARLFICGGRPIQIGGSGWSPRLVFDDGDNLGGYEISVRHSAYFDLRTIVTEKFGDGTRSSVRYSTRAGGVVEGEQWRWAWPSGTVADLREYCDRVDLSCLTVCD